MEITFINKTVKAQKALSSWNTFYAVAMGDVDGVKVWFGSYTKGGCDMCIEDSTKVRCGYLTPKSKDIEGRVKELADDLLAKIQMSACSFQEVIDNYLRGARPGRSTLISVWHISLLIGC